MTLEEILVAMDCAPSKKGYQILQVLEFLYLGNSVKSTAQTLHFAESTLYRWIKRFNEKGLDALVFKGGSGRPRKIPLEKFQAEYVPIILEPARVEEDNLSAIKFHRYLREECQESLCYQTLLNYLHESKISQVVPRPSVTGKQDEERRSEYLIKFKDLVTAEREIWFCDEVGFEGDPRPRSKWVKVGSKPVAGRTSEHLRYSAIGSVNAISGELVSLVVPEVDGEIFQVYLDELSKATKERAIILVLDNASWHKSSKLNWHNITGLYLPPYSPDFNPIENLWRYMKLNYFAGWYAKTIEELIEKICSAFQDMTTNKAQIQSTTNSAYLVR